MSLVTFSAVGCKMQGTFDAPADIYCMEDTAID